MEDGVAGSIILFVFLLLTEIVLYGFNTAMQKTKKKKRSILPENRNGSTI